MKAWDFMSLSTPKQEFEIWIKPLFSNRFVRYTTGFWDDIRNDFTLMEEFKAVTVTSFFGDDDGLIVIHAIEE